MAGLATVRCISWSISFIRSQSEVTSAGPTPCEGLARTLFKRIV